MNYTSPNIQVKEFRIKIYPKNFAVARDFYENYLGFKIVHEWDKGKDGQGVMFNVGGTILELLSRKRGVNYFDGIDVSLEVDDVKKLWEKFKKSGNIIFPLRENDWGDMSFCISDPEQSKLTFFTKI